jgi:hypothetical protein
MRLIKDIILKGLIPIAIGIPFLYFLPPLILEVLVCTIAAILAWGIGALVVVLFLTIAGLYKKGVER